jgi:hypothetical protein
LVRHKEARDQRAWKGENREESDPNARRDQHRPSQTPQLSVLRPLRTSSKDSKQEEHWKIHVSLLFGTFRERFEVLKRVTIDFEVIILARLGRLFVIPTHHIVVMGQRDMISMMVAIHCSSGGRHGGG